MLLDIDEVCLIGGNIPLSISEVFEAVYLPLDPSDVAMPVFGAIRGSISSDQIQWHYFCDHEAMYVFVEISPPMLQLTDRPHTHADTWETSAQKKAKALEPSGDANATSPQHKEYPCIVRAEHGRKFKISTLVRNCCFALTGSTLCAFMK
jgi:hypothetical protein